MTMTTTSDEVPKPTIDQVKSIKPALDVKRALDMGWDSVRIEKEMRVQPDLIEEVIYGDYWWLENLLDKGYVRLVDWMGDELAVVNAARASFAKESFEMSSSDARLIKYLGEHGHFSVFRHNFITVEICAPIEITRQWWKYVTGSAHTDSFSTAWNEASRRYLSSNIEFYIPEKNEWRSKPDNMKQGSGGPIDPGTGALLSDELEAFCEEGRGKFEWAVEDLGVAPEMARLFLPAYGMYTTWRWSSSLQAMAFFLHQRKDEGAQSEIQKYANKLDVMLNKLYPLSLSALMKGLAND